MYDKTVNWLKKNTPKYFFENLNPSTFQKRLFQIYYYRIGALIMTTVCSFITIVSILSVFFFDLTFLSGQKATVMVQWHGISAILAITLILAIWPRKLRHKFVVPWYITASAIHYFATGYLLVPGSGLGSLASFVYLVPIIGMLAPLYLYDRLALMIGTPLFWFIGLYMKIGFVFEPFVYTGFGLYVSVSFCYIVSHLFYFQLLESSFYRERELRQKKQTIDKIAKYDPLTDLYRRAEFNRQLDNRIERAHKYDEKIAVFMIDLDHFKKVNDNYGHDVGDKVLRKFADRLAKVPGENIRSTDLVGRYGGEEFAAAFGQVDDGGVMQIAQRLRKMVENEIFVEDGGFNLTVSIGVAHLRVGDTRDDIMKRADQALYEAKKERNTVSTFSDVSEAENNNN